MRHLFLLCFLIYSFGIFGQQLHQPYLPSQFQKDFPNIEGVEAIYVHEVRIDTSLYKQDDEFGPLVQKIKLNEDQTIKEIRFYVGNEMFPTDIFHYTYEAEERALIKKMNKNYKTLHGWVYQNDLLLSEQLNNKNGKLISKWQYTYNSKRNPVRYIHLDKKNDTLYAKSFTYDDLGRSLYNFELSQGDTIKKNRYFYNSPGIEKLKEVDPDVFSGETLVHLIETDSTENEISIQIYKSVNHKVYHANIDYNEANKPVKIDIQRDDDYFPASNSFSYDDRGNLMSAENSKNKPTQDKIWNTYFIDTYMFVHPTHVADSDRLVPPLYYKKILDHNNNLVELFYENHKSNLLEHDVLKKTFILRDRAK